MGANMPSSWWNNPNRLKKSGIQIVELSESPREISASMNRQRFKYYYLSTLSPSRASIIFTINRVPNAGANTFSITLGTYTLFRDFSLTPSFNEIVTFSTNTVQNQQNVAEAIAYELQNDPFVALNYEVYSDANDIYINSKSFSTDFNISFASTNLSYSFVVSNTPASPRYFYEAPIDYNTFFRIFVDDSTLFGDPINRVAFEEVGELLLQPTSSSINHFVQQYTANEVSYNLPQRNFTPQNFLYTALDITAGTKKHLKPYYVLYGDSFRYTTNGDIKFRTVGVSEIRWVQVGNKDILNPYSFDSSVIDINFFDSKTSLTSQPAPKRVYEGSIEFLQYIIKKPTSSTLWSVRLDVTFFDGTTTNLTYAGGDLNGIGGNFIVDISPLSLDIPNIENINNKYVQKYRVSFIHNRGGQIIHNPIEYLYEHDCNLNYTNFLWLNENGAWDSFTFNGDTSVETDFENSTVSTSLSFDELPFQEVNKIYLKNQSDTLSVSSGLLNDANYKFLFGLLQSTAVFVWDSTVNDWKAVQILSSDYDQTNDGQPKQLRINYKKTYNVNTLRK